jgi:hypothetical protein
MVALTAHSAPSTRGKPAVGGRRLCCSSPHNPTRPGFRYRGCRPRQTEPAQRDSSRLQTTATKAQCRPAVSPKTSRWRQPLAQDAGFPRTPARSATSPDARRAEHRRPPCHDIDRPRLSAHSIKLCSRCLVIAFLFAVPIRTTRLWTSWSDLDRQLASTYCQGCVVLSLCRDAGKSRAETVAFGVQSLIASELIMVGIGGRYGAGAESDQDPPVRLKSLSPKRDS